MLSEWLKEINYENTSTGIINMNMDNSPSLQYRSGQLFVSGDMDYVSIFNVNGSKVMQTDEKDINNIPVGIYIVQLVTNNASKTYKFRAAD